jgi:putative CocE/NonD family hydrolase
VYSGVTKLIAPGVLLQRDLRIPLSDGTRLALNAFHPTDELPHPAILSVTPYGKDNLPDRKGMLMMRFAGVRFGRLNCSRWTGFESPDPLFWVRRRYAVVQADVRGMHESEGSTGVLRKQDANDDADLIA